MAQAKLSTRIVCISDTHSAYGFTLPEGDILVHGGDFSSTGMFEEVQKYVENLKNLKNFRLKIIIAGNHDITIDEKFYEKNWNRFHRTKQPSEQARALLTDPKLQTDYGIVYLEDQSFVDPVTKLKFYGSPWQPEFCNWAFNVTRNSEEMRGIWAKIPDDTDVLITHGPPYGILDTTMNRIHAGCEVLLQRVQSIRPKLHVFGHIHEAYGKVQHDQSSTIFVNASTCNLRYKPVQPPIVVEL